jgi:hypothetical protein
MSEPRSVRAAMSEVSAGRSIAVPGRGLPGQVVHGEHAGIKDLKELIVAIFGATVSVEHIQKPSQSARSNRANGFLMSLLAVSDALRLRARSSLRLPLSGSRYERPSEMVPLISPTKQPLLTTLSTRFLRLGPDAVVRLYLQ